jgi:hypothetical protein
MQIFISLFSLRKLQQVATGTNATRANSMQSKEFVDVFRM